MEQLNNLPLWAQLFSVGSFMFASGLLMTRFPLAPVLILSFFYTYGVFSSSSRPSFCLTHPWIWAICLLLPVLLLLLLWVGFYWCLSSASGPDSMGLGFAGAWLFVITVPVLGICFLVSVIPAWVKMVKLLAYLHPSAWQTTVLCVLFALGIILGICSLSTPGLLSNPLDNCGNFMQLFSGKIFFFSLLICTLSLLCIKLGRSLNGGFILGLTVCLVWSVCQHCYFHVRFQRLSQKYGWAASAKNKPAAHSQIHRG